MKKSIRNLIFGSIISISVGLLLSSCNSYLDKAPESTISTQEVFGTFKSFQGFVEELYNCTPDYTKSTWDIDWNIADEILPTQNVDWRLVNHFDNGDYWYWYTTAWGWNQSYLMKNGANTGSWNAMAKGLWPLSWYGIRKANVGLANLDKLTGVTDDEKNVIKGQLLFFRGLFHFQLMSYWGGLPYIDTVLNASSKMQLPRLSYRDCALKAAKDLAESVDLLPSNWDNAPYGQATTGNNNQRVTKSMAYAFLGKDLLYAASPLMNKGVTGTPTDYDADLCKQAAQAFYNCLHLSYTGEAYYKLADWSNYSKLFYTLDNSMPGYPEVLWAAPSYGWLGCSNSGIYVSINGSNGVSPTANYIDNYGMASGLPIEDPASGYNPADPWTGRDPRFYNNFVYNWQKIVQGGSASLDSTIRYASLYNGGYWRNDLSHSVTGYMLKKFVPLTVNSIDKGPGPRVADNYLRLADVYLMYAEAVAYGWGDPKSYGPSAGKDLQLTAVDAFNKVRQRAGVGNIADKFTTSTEAFKQELIRERAVEFAYEANIRWMDLRRWLIGTQDKYLKKTALDFDEGPRHKPINMRERVVKTRVFTNRCYWLPLPTTQVNLYPSFGQNPGW